MSLTDVWWLQQTEADVPPGNQWLSRAEADRAAGFRIPKRRNDWRLGRWTAKCAVSIYPGREQGASSLSQIEVRPAPSGAPEVFISNLAADITISLSHRAGAAICAVAPAGVQLGCDVELIEPHSDAFIRDYFTAEEQAMVDNCDEEEREALVTLIWSAKESALKALRTGLLDDTRSVSVFTTGNLHGNNCWTELCIRIAGARLLCGWWQRSERLLRTIVAEPKARLPIALAELAGAAGPETDF